MQMHSLNQPAEETMIKSIFYDFSSALFFGGVPPGKRAFLSFRVFRHRERTELPFSGRGGDLHRIRAAGIGPEANYFQEVN